MGPSDHESHGRRPWDLLITSHTPTWEATVGPSDHESPSDHVSHTLWEATVGPSDHESHTHMGGDRGTF